MKDEDFMKQTAVDMTVRELLEAIRMKAKQDKHFVDEMTKAMREIDVRKDTINQVFESPLQNPEILRIVQLLVQMDKNFAERRKPK